MARTVAGLPEGTRITDFISLGVVAKTFPLATVREILSTTGKTSMRERDLPAHVVMYYVIALGLYMQCSYREVLRCLLEGLQWLTDPLSGLKVAGKSGISQARTRLGVEPVRQLHDAVVCPIAVPTTKGAWYRGWRLVSLDGSTLDVADGRSRLVRRPAGMTLLSAGLGAAGARVLILRSPSSLWSRMAPMCCSVVKWRAIGPAKQLWLRRCLRPACSGACCV